MRMLTKKLLIIIKAKFIELLIMRGVIGETSLKKEKSQGRGQGRNLKA